jgi:hypothetical protein
VELLLQYNGPSVFVLESKDACTGPWQWLPVTEVFPSSELNIQDMSVCTFPCGEYEVKHIPFEEAIKHLPQITAEAEVLHSDLVPGKYEGWFIQY